MLTNEARHRVANRSGAEPKSRLEVRIDPFSSAFAFQGWEALLPDCVRFEFSTWPEDKIESWYAEILSAPRTWLLARGWARSRLA